MGSITGQNRGFVLIPMVNFFPKLYLECCYPGKEPGSESIWVMNGPASTFVVSYLRVISLQKAVSEHFVLSTLFMKSHQISFLAAVRWVKKYPCLLLLV